MFILLLLYAVCASTFTLCKTALMSAQPFFYIALRMLCAGALLTMGAYVFDKQIRIRKADIGLFAQVIIFHIFFAYMLDIWSLQYITSIESSLIFNMSPLLAAVLSYVWFGELLTYKKVLGLLIGMCSLVPLFMQQTLHYSGLPVFGSLAAVTSAAYGWIVLKELVAHRGYNPLLVNGIGMLGGGALALCASLVGESWNPYPVHDWSALLLSTFAIIIVGNGIFYNLYGYLLKKYSATLLSFAGFSCPFFVMLYSFLFLNEPITLSVLVAALCVLTGLTLFYYEELRAVQKI